MSRAPDIAKLHAKRDVKGLIKALAYPGEVTVRVNAARALGELGDPRAVEPLVAMLQNKQHFVAEPLARLGDPRAVEPLIAALGEDRYGGVARALGMLRDSRAVGPLLGALGSGERSVVQSAALALGEMGDPCAVDGLVAVLAHDDELVPRAAVDALMKIGGPSIAPLTVALEDGDPRRRAAAVEALDMLGWSPDEGRAGAAYWGARGEWHRWAQCIQTTEPPITVLRVGDQDMRAAAVEALDRLGWHPEQGDLGARYWAAKGEWGRCVEIGAPAVEPLIGALADRDEGVRRAAVQALAEIGAPAVEPVIAAYRRERFIGLREAAVNALLDMRDPAGAEPLVAALTSDDKLLRETAAEALVRIGWDPHDSAAEGTFRVVRMEWDKAAEAGACAVEPLIAALGERRGIGDLDRSTCEAVARALGEIGDPRAVEPLIAALAHWDPSVSGAAATALARIGDPCAVAPLVARLTKTRNEAYALALDRLGWRPDDDEADVAYWGAKGEWERCRVIGASVVEPLIAQLGAESHAVRLRAAETLVTIYRSGRLDKALAATLLAQRERMVAAHHDRHYDTHCAAEDQHTDSGIGLDFPVEPEELVPPEDELGTAAGLSGPAVTPAEALLMAVGGEIPASVFAALGSDDHRARRQAITVLKSAGYQDPVDARSFALLGRTPGVEYSREELKKDVEKFPDFDIAYVRAAYPTGASEDHAHADVSLFPEAIVRCTVKGRLLGRLSSYFTWAGDYLKALDYGAADVLLGDPSEGPSDMVQVLVLLAGAFRRVGLEDDAGLALRVTAPYELGPIQAAAVERAAAALASVGAGDVRWAAETVRDKLRRAQRELRR